MATGLVDKSFVSSNDELFYLKWNNFQKNVSTQFEKLREEDDLVDITFACEGRKLTAHKLVLFACSPFFKELLKKNPSPHPVFFMNDVKYDVLKAILEYMYLGEVHITNENLKDFIKTAEGLQIRGLSKENNTDLSMPPAPATPQSSSVGHMIPIGRKVIIDDKETIVTAENVQLLDELCRKRPVDTGTGGDLTGGGQVVGLNIKRIKTTVVESSQIQSSDGSGSSSNVAPKVEMVEYLDAETTNHQSPTYCSMDNFTEKSNSRNNLTHMGQINTATFTQTPTQPSSSGHQQQQQQQQQQHVQHEYKSEEDSSWMDKSLDNISVNSEHQQQQQQQGQQTVKYKGKSGGGGGGGGSSRSQRSTEDKTNCLTPRCCPVCSRLYSNVSNLRQHMRLIHNPTAVCCPICQKHFNSELYLKRHYSSIHSINAGTGTGDGGELVEQKPQPAQLAAQQTPQQQQQQHQGQQQQQQQQQQTNNQQQQQQQQAPTPASTNTWNPYHHESQLVNPFIK